MGYLLVIDMQVAYAGAKSRAARQSNAFLPSINARIAAYAPHQVLYVIQRNWFGFGYSPLLTSLTQASNHIFKKHHANCFTNGQLLEFLRRNNATALELVGVDGCACVGVSAQAGARLGFSIALPLSCIGTASPKQFLKAQAVLAKGGVQLLPE